MNVIMVEMIKLNHMDQINALGKLNSPVHNHDIPDLKYNLNNPQHDFMYICWFKSQRKIQRPADE